MLDEFHQETYEHTTILDTLGMIYRNRASVFLVSADYLHRCTPWPTFWQING